MEIAEEEKHTIDPDFWNDSKKAEQTMRRIRNVKVWTDADAEAEAELEDMKVLIEFHKEGEADEEDVRAQYEKTLALIEDLEFKPLLSAEEDSFNAVMQITAGAGGTESCDWAS